MPVWFLLDTAFDKWHADQQRRLPELLCIPKFRALFTCYTYLLIIAQTAAIVLSLSNKNKQSSFRRQTIAGSRQMCSSRPHSVNHSVRRIHFFLSWVLYVRNINCQATCTWDLSRSVRISQYPAIEWVQSTYYRTNAIAAHTPHSVYLQTRPANDRRANKNTSYLITDIIFFPLLYCRSTVQFFSIDFEIEP